jgi:hypothetical protein
MIVHVSPQLLGPFPWGLHALYLSDPSAGPYDDGSAKFIAIVSGSLFLPRGATLADHLEGSRTGIKTFAGQTSEIGYVPDMKKPVFLCLEDAWMIATHFTAKN